MSCIDCNLNLFSQNYHGTQVAIILPKNLESEKSNDLDELGYFENQTIAIKEGYDQNDPIIIKYKTNFYTDMKYGFQLTWENRIYEDPIPFYIDNKKTKLFNR